ncbi:MAG: hypothetical protein Q9191_002997 [Dirinaria sp. TL-2023a]
MSLRCPSSPYVGVARLPAYRWIINSRGYANIVSSKDSADVVYGLVYDLTAADEVQLDINEGVPEAYTKETMKATLWTAKDEEHDYTQGRDAAGQEKDLLVYIDREKTKGDKPKQEYVHRMNMGIKDALEKGMPQDYIDQAIRSFIPQEDSDSAHRDLAHRQAMRFEDER